MAAGTPTIRRRRLGSELRRLREAAGLKHEHAVAHLGCSQAKISQIEHGRTGLKKLELEGLLALYGAGTRTVGQLLELRAQANQRGWWTEYASVLPYGFGTYVDLESEASSAQVYEPVLIPGLLQTKEYTKALVSGNLPESTTADVERFLELRAARQHAIRRTGAPLRLWVVLDEAALHRQVGGPAAMRNQLASLLVASRLPNVTIQVLPFTTGSYAGMRGAFTVFELPHPSDPEVAYVECPAGNMYLEEPDQLREHKRRFSHLQVTALAPDTTARLIRQTMKEMA